MIARTCLSLALLVPSLALAQEINLRNANFYLPQTDVSIQKPGAPLELLRAYNSRSNEDGFFGYGWSTPLDVKVQIHADGSLMVVDHDGYIMVYTYKGAPAVDVRRALVTRLVEARRLDDKAHGTERGASAYQDLAARWMESAPEREEASWQYPAAWVEPADGSYTSYDRGVETLVKKADRYERVRADGLMETFDTQGRLTMRQDVAGHGLRLDYDRDNRLSKVAHSDGAGFTVLYGTAGKIQEVRDTEGRVLTYTYDETGNLTRVDGPSSRVRAYAYDEEHNLVAVRDPDGGGLQISYNKEKDWAIALKDGESITRYDWQLLDDQGQRFVCTVTGPEDQTVRHEFDDEKRVTTETDSQGQATRILYSACCNKPLEVRTADGSVTRYDYDTKNRLIAVTRPDGVTARYTYHPDYNRIVEATFSDGRRYAYSFDEAGRIVKVDAAVGRGLVLVYGANGKVESITDSDGVAYLFVYNADGQPTRITGRKGTALDLHYGVGGEMTGSEVTTPSSAIKQRFYRDLKDVLAMLEPAAGRF